AKTKNKTPCFKKRNTYPKQVVKSKADPNMRSLLLFSLLLISVQSTFAQLVWQDTPSLDSFPIYDFHPTTDGLLIAMSGGGIQKTTDEGASWYNIPFVGGLEGNTFFSDFAQIGNTIYVAARRRVASQEGGIYKSLDQGETWQASYDENLHKDVFSLVSVGNRLIAGTRRGIFLSDDGGNSWSRVDEEEREARRSIPFCMTTKGNTVVAGTNRSVLLSQDAGDTWQVIEIADRGDVNRAAFVNNHFYVSTSGSGIYRSENGSSWEKLDLGLPENQENINAFLMLGQDQYYSSAGNIYKNRKPINEGFSMDFPSARSFTVYKGSLYAGTYRDGVWKYAIPNNEIANVPKLNLQPNPSASQAVQLSYEVLEEGSISIVLYDQNGKQLQIIADLQQSVGKYQIEVDVSQLQNGNYYFHYQNEQYQQTQSLIIAN
ncbi:MAG: T9SS type A sorting domain-containing protein, partial [Bacteroidota bacterium]